MQTSKGDLSLSELRRMAVTGTKEQQEQAKAELQKKLGRRREDEAPQK